MRFAIGERVPSPFDRTTEQGAKISLSPNGHVIISVRFLDMSAEDALDLQTGAIETGVMHHDRSWMGLMRVGAFTMQLYFDATMTHGSVPSREMDALFLGIECRNLILRSLRVAALPARFLDTWIESIEAYESDKTGYEEEYARFCDLINSMDLRKVWDVCQRTGTIARAV